MFQFSYVGGVIKPDRHQTDKFLLFFVLGGDEVPFHVAKRDGLVQEAEACSNRFICHTEIVKIFTSQSGFGIPKRWYSFYVKFLPEPAPKVTITGFPIRTEINQRAMRPNGESIIPSLEFKGHVSFLTNNQAASILNDRNSKQFVLKQGLLPTDTLRQMISVDRSGMKKGIRLIRLGNR